MEWSGSSFKASRGSAAVGLVGFSSVPFQHGREVGRGKLVVGGEASVSTEDALLGIGFKRRRNPRGKADVFGGLFGLGLFSNGTTASAISPSKPFCRSAIT